MSELTASCPECHMTVTLDHRRVVVPTASYHHDCYEAWHVHRYGRRPWLRRRFREPRVYEDRCGTEDLPQSA